MGTFRAGLLPNASSLQRRRTDHEKKESQGLIDGLLHRSASDARSARNTIFLGVRIFAVATAQNSPEILNFETAP